MLMTGFPRTQSPRNEFVAENPTSFVADTYRHQLTMSALKHFYSFTMVSLGSVTAMLWVCLTADSTHTVCSPRFARYSCAELRIMTFVELMTGLTSLTPALVWSLGSATSWFAIVWGLLAAPCASCCVWWARKPRRNQRTFFLRFVWLLRRWALSSVCRFCRVGSRFPCQPVARFCCFAWRAVLSRAAN